MLSLGNLLKHYYAKKHEAKKDVEIPSAGELLAMTKKKWKVITAEEIIEVLIEKSKEGEREAYFHNVIIEEDTIDILKAKGYTVVQFSSESSYKISW